MMIRERWVLLLVGIGAALVAVRGCSSSSSPGTDPQPDGSDAGPPEVDRSDEAAPLPDRTEGSEPESSPVDAACPPRPLPEGVPDGWEEVPIFDCLHRVYVPSAPEYLPPRLEWEDCTDLGPDTYACRQLVVDRPGEEPLFVSGIPNGYPDSAGVMLQVRLRLLRADAERAFMALLAEADGAVRQGFWTPYHPYNQAPFRLSPRGVAPGKSAWDLTRWVAGSMVEGAAMAGDDTDLRPPILLEKLASDRDSASIVPATNYYAERGSSIRVRGWDGSDFGVVSHNVAQLAWFEDTLLWETDSVWVSEIWRWTEQGGSSPLVSFGGDDSRGAGNIATDGNDLVWVQGEGRLPTGDWVFPIRSIMTAPFTTDPAQLRPRRLRSWQPEVIGAAMKLPAAGCGYAAFRVVPNNDVIDLLIVRLSDGVSWTLRSPSDHRWVWGRPIVISCEEVFTTWGHGGNGHLRRIRLDSLGPGMPPD